MPESLASDQPEVSADYDSSLWDIDGSWLIGSHWKPLRAKKALVQSQSFERQPGAQSRLLTTFISQARPLCQHGIRWLFLSNMQKPTQRVKRNEEIKEYVANKRQNKSPEISLNETQINDLLNREIKIMNVQMLLKVRKQCMDKVRISKKRQDIYNLPKRNRVNKNVEKREHFALW